MKKIVLSLTLCFTLLLGACGNSIGDDLKNYINEDIRPLISSEQEILTEYESVTGENYTDDETTYYTLEESIIPKYQVFIDKIEAIQPETEEVRELHEDYIQASNNQYNAMLKIMSALENQDYSEVSEANQMLTESRAAMRQYNNDLYALAKEHGIKITE